MTSDCCVNHFRINVHDVFVEINGRPVINSKPYRVMALLNKFSPPKTIKALITKPEHNIGLYPIKDQHKTVGVDILVSVAKSVLYND